MESPIEQEESVFSKSESWEKGGRYGFGFPGSVNHNGSHFIMHYVAGGGRLGVAFSVDGFQWTKQHMQPEKVACARSVMLERMSCPVS